MGLIRISNIRENMVLGADLFDHTGRLLLTKGTSLTQKHIKICKMWGVIEADIEATDPEEMEEEWRSGCNPDHLAEVQEMVSEWYALSDIEHPVVKELFRLSVKQALMGRFKDNGNGINNSSPAVTREINSQSIKTKNILKMIGEDTRLSTFPKIFSQINNILAEQSSSAQEIADTIQKDTNLTAKVLRIVNSAFYGYPSHIDRISRAITIIGTKQLSTLVIGINILDTFRDIPNSLINMKLFWEHSLLCGINARIIGGYRNIQNTERLFVGGVLHDIGRLFLFNNVPELACFMIEKAKREGKHLFQIEKNLIGIDHTELAEALFKQWSFPMSLECLARYHHAPLESFNRVETSIIHVSDVLAYAMGIGSSGEKHLPPIDMEAWELIGMSPNILNITAQQSERHLSEIFECFFEDAQ